MDLAKPKGKPIVETVSHSSLGLLLRILIYGGHAYFIYYLVARGLSETLPTSYTENGNTNNLHRVSALAEYVMIRNQLYIGYAVVLIIIGLFAIRSSFMKISPHNNERTAHTTGFTILPYIIQSCILTTFSYALAGFILIGIHFIQRFGIFR